MNRRYCEPVLALLLAAAQAGCSSLSARGVDRRHPNPATTPAAPLASATPATHADAIQDARSLLKLTHQWEVTESVLMVEVGWAVAQLHQRYPSLTAPKLRLIGQTMMNDLAAAAEAPNGLMDQEAALYARYYTDTELREMIAFFRRPAGQSMLIEGPQIEHDLGAIQRQWAASVAAHVFDDVRAKVGRPWYPGPPGR